MKKDINLYTSFQKSRITITPLQNDYQYNYSGSALCSFNGKEKDWESGFHYYGARYYWSEVLTGWLSVDPMMDKYPGISPYTYCNFNPIALVDPDGMTWKDIDGNIVSDHSNIKVYIFYDPKSFETQSIQMYNDAIEKYGVGSVALSDVTTEREFAQDWHDMGGNDIREINLNYHGSNQALHLNHETDDYITSTGDGITNVSGARGLDIEQLPSIKGNIKNAQLNINSCHSNKKDGNLRGSKKTIMQSFYDSFDFKTVRGTSRGVSYSRIGKQPHPGRGWSFFASWDFLPNIHTNTNFTNYIGSKR